MWSSPISASTPPCLAVPARLAWRNTSPVRSTPGPLPYHMANTPSNLPSPRSSACCVPQTAVAARSSLMPPWKRMSLLLRNGCGALELAVETAERRTAIAGDKAGGIEAVAAVELLLHQAEPDQRLEAGDEDAALAEVVFVVEFDVAQRHRARPSNGRQSVCPRGVDIARGTGTEVDIRCGPRAAIGPIEARLSQWFRRPRY